MDRLIRRARGRSGGFSFVELLVTIIIAGIAFAALVPVFLGAQKAVAGDQLRNSALQLAQDKLEKIRALDYDVIKAANLDSSSFMGGQFGNSVQWATGGGTRAFTVTYQVDLLPTGATEGTESHKKVTVRVTWAAPPDPRPAVLTTMVSKQYAGPQIVRFEIGPPFVLRDEGGSSTIVSGPVVIDAYISPDDILSMNQSATEANRGYVQFTVSSLNGTEVATQKVTTPVSGQPSRYQFTWDNSAAADGVYVFQAVAVAGFGSRTQGNPVSIALWHLDSTPPPPTNLSALSGNGVVYLTWTTPAVGDLDYYEVWRSDDGGATYAKLADASTESFTDNTVTNGSIYYYKVRTVDTEELVSAFTDPIVATPDVPGDNLPPSVPTPLTAEVLSEQPTVRLTWSESVDYGSPASGVAGYVVERSSNGATDWAQLVSLYQATTFDDVGAGWATTWFYRVKAVDNVGNASGWAGPVSVTTGAAPSRSLSVTNNSNNNQVHVWVQSVSTSLWYSTNGVASATRPGGVRVGKGNTTVWNSLQPDVYNVYFSTSNSWANVAVTKVVDVTSANGTTAYP